MPNESEPRRILCLWLPNWPIQRLVVAQPELRRSRVILFRQDPRRGQRVAAASPLAQRDGVRIDMPLSELKGSAQRLQGSGTDCPQQPSGRSGNQCLPPRILPHDPAADWIAIQQLADDLDGFSPIIGLQQETEQPDCIFLDITGLGPLFGGEFKLAESLARHCHDRGYLPRIAVAHTIGLAQGIAQYQTPEPNASAWPAGPTATACNPGQTGSTSNAAVPAAAADLTSATIIIPSGAPVIPSGATGSASAESRPDITIVPTHERQAHHSLPVTALRISPQTTNTLNQLGIERVDQLQQLPRRDLLARFGDEIHRRLDQMTGRLDEPIVARQQPPEFYAEQLLDYPTSHKETMHAILHRLIAHICAELSAAQQGALQWTIRLFHQQKLPLKLYVSLFQPTATPEHVIQLVDMQLEQALQPVSAAKRRQRQPSRRPLHPLVRLHGQPIEVNEITVAVTSAVLLTHRQRQLFDENPRLDRQSLAHLINRLSGRLGRHRVVYPTLVSGAQPEHAFQFRPLVNPHHRQPRRTAVKTAHTHHAHVLARPLKMFQPSIELQTVALSTTHHGSDTAHPPALLVFSDQRQAIINHWGPERIETGWWRGSTARRDYWRVETDTGQQFWIYHDLRKHTWFLHGAF